MKIDALNQLVARKSFIYFARTAIEHQTAAMAETKLIFAVIACAIADATGPKYKMYKNKKNGKIYQETFTETYKARKWVDKDDKGFQKICNLIGLSEEWCEAVIQREIALYDHWEYQRATDEQKRKIDLANSKARAMGYHVKPPNEIYFSP
jgi:hypothetical protein